MNIAITGHRPNKLGNDYELTSPLIQRIKTDIVGILVQNSTAMSWHWKDDSVEIHDIKLITGMALGIDTLFAKIAIEFNIPFIAAIPFYDQDSKWPPCSQKIYHDLINHPLCELVIVSPGDYSPAKMQIRNQWMVDNCDLLIGVHNGTPGGTNNCLKYATSVGKETIIIKP